MNVLNYCYSIIIKLFALLPYALGLQLTPDLVVCHTATTNTLFTPYSTYYLLILLLAQGLLAFSCLYSAYNFECELYEDSLEYIEFLATNQYFKC